MDKLTRIRDKVFSGPLGPLLALAIALIWLAIFFLLVDTALDLFR